MDNESVLWLIRYFTGSGTSTRRNRKYHHRERAPKKKGRESSVNPTPRYDIYFYTYIINFVWNTYLMSLIT